MMRYTFVLKLTDRPGGMELVAAQFGHRGVSISSSLGNDGTLDVDGRATVVITFSATPAKKEALKRSLSRLSRVVSLVEHGDVAEDVLALRQAAMVRLSPSAPAPVLPEGIPGYVEHVGENTFMIVAPVSIVDALLAAAHADGVLLQVTHTVVAL